MPSLKEHCDISKKRTGKEFRELHEWIDAPKEYLGINHRIERHADNEMYRTVIIEKFGDKAVIEWLFHIAIDNLQTAYKASHAVYKDRTFNYYRFALSPGDEMFFDCGKLNEVQLLKKFKGEED
jgi:hypothetical protein